MGLITQTNKQAPSGPDQKFYRSRNGSSVAVPVGTPGDVSPLAGSPETLEAGDSGGKVYLVFFTAQRSNSAIAGAASYVFQLDGVSQSDAKSASSGLANEETTQTIFGLVKTIPGNTNALTVFCSPAGGTETVDARELWAIEIGDGVI